MTAVWESDSNAINFSLDGELVFADSKDHWENGVLRLLNIKEDYARSWIRFCSEDKFYWNITGLIERTNIFFNIDKILFNMNDFGIVSESIDGDSDLFIKSAGIDQFAELFSKKNEKKVLPPEYEESYFEGHENNYGYGDLGAQSSWRLEKAWRYYNILATNMLKDNFNIKKLRKVLDIGSGYGFMRKPFLENKIPNDGIEISNFAIKIAKKLFNIDTFNISVNLLDQKYECVLAYDLIEHLENPEEYIRKIRTKLLSNGYLVIRTPNLSSLEFFMFGNKYHSFKKEHLNYFTVQSLISLLQNCGFKILNIETESHLISGLQYINIININHAHLGSDIYCIAKRID